MTTTDDVTLANNDFRVISMTFPMELISEFWRNWMLNLYGTSQKNRAGQSPGTLTKQLKVSSTIVDWRFVIFRTALAYQRIKIWRVWDVNVYLKIVKYAYFNDTNEKKGKKCRIVAAKHREIRAANGSWTALVRHLPYLWGKQVYNWAPALRNSVLTMCDSMGRMVHGFRRQIADEHGLKARLAQRWVASRLSNRRWRSTCLFY